MGWGGEDGERWGEVWMIGVGGEEGAGRLGGGEERLSTSYYRFNGRFI